MARRNGRVKKKRREGERACVRDKESEREKERQEKRKRGKQPPRPMGSGTGAVLANTVLMFPDATVPRRALGVACK